MSERSLVLNAFRPNSEIDNPAAFAGRSNQVKELTDALLSDGSVPVIYGNRGIGKTSLAVQLARIALGDDQLLNNLNAGDRALTKEDVFIPFWISCSDETRNKDQILQRIINTAEGYSEIAELGNDSPASRSFRTSFKLKIFEAEAIENYEKSGRKYSKLGLGDQFFTVLETLAKHGINRTLFIIDELDRVSSTKGLSNFIKNATSNYVKFMLVGISNTISTLIDDHESLQRSLHPVVVSQMNKNELSEIIDKAINLLTQSGVKMSFSRDARKILVSTAGGFPWFVHVLGREALRICWEKRRNIVSEKEAQTAISTLATNRFAQQFSDCYQTAVGDSMSREIVLRLMAKWGGDDVYLSEIYPIAKKIGITNPSMYKKDLTRKSYGSVIITPPQHKKGVIRFRDNMFKRYINLRDSIYDGTKEQVDMAWEESSEE